MRVVDFDIRHQQHHFGAGDIFRGDPIFYAERPWVSTFRCHFS